MKKIIVLTTILFAQMTLAGGWIPTGSYVNSATEINGIRGIINNFPEIMDDREFAIEDISTLQVSLIALTYEGETTCRLNDERLSYQHFSYFICLKERQGACIDHFDEFKADSDPCL